MNRFGFWYHLSARRELHTTKKVGELIPISVSISSNFVKQPINLWNTDPHYFVASFIAAFGNSASPNNWQMKTLFFNIEKAKKINLDRTLETLSQRHYRLGQFTEAEDVSFYQNSDDSCVCTKFLQKQRSQPIDLQVYLERYCKLFFVFGFNSEEMTSIQSSPFCYRHLSTDNILKQWLIKKLTNISF